MLVLIGKLIAGGCFDLWVKDPTLGLFILQISQDSHFKYRTLTSQPALFCA